MTSLSSVLFLAFFCGISSAALRFVEHDEWRSSSSAMSVGYWKFNNGTSRDVGICRVHDDGYNNRWMGWFFTDTPICNYVAVAPSDVPGPGDQGPQKMAKYNFDFVAADSSVCWSPQDPNSNGWSPNIIVPAYTFPPRQLAGLCRTFVTGASYGALIGHLIVHIGYGTVCVAGLPNGAGLVSSLAFEIGIAC